MLDEFISKLPEKFAVNQPERLKNAPRQCEFYLISLDPINGTAIFNEVTQSFLEALRWNRYGIFVFVALDEVKKLSKHDLNFYCMLVKSLGLTNSILVSVRNDTQAPLVVQFQYRLIILEDIKTAKSALTTDYLFNVHGHPFNVYLFNNEPFLYLISRKVIIGPHVNVFNTFAKNINATLRYSLAIYKSYDVQLLVNALTDGTASVINLFTYIRRYADVMNTYSQPGLCVMIPEKLIGSIFNHLLRPFSHELLFAIAISLIVIPIISPLFPKDFPRGILRQVFYGSLISGYAMSRVERFTIFSFTLILFLLSESYLAKLFQLMFQHQYEAHLKSFDDLISTGATIYAQSVFYQHQAIGLYPQIKNNLHLLKEAVILMEANEVLFTSCVFAEYCVNSKSNIHPTSRALKYYILPEKIPFITEAFTHSRLQPFAKRFELVYSRLQEAGFLNFWLETSNSLWLPTPASRLQVVEFEQLFSLWKLLVLGFAISWGAFVLEICSHYVWLKFVRKL